MDPGNPGTMDYNQLIILIALVVALAIGMWIGLKLGEKS